MVKTVNVVWRNSARKDWLSSIGYQYGICATCYFSSVFCRFMFDIFRKYYYTIISYRNISYYKKEKEKTRC